MNRRGFLKLLGGAAASAVILPDEEEVKRFWTGFGPGQAKADALETGWFDTRFPPPHKYEWGWAKPEPLAPNTMAIINSNYVQHFSATMKVDGGGITFADWAQALEPRATPFLDHHKTKAFSNVGGVWVPDADIHRGGLALERAILRGEPVWPKS